VSRPNPKLRSRTLPLALLAAVAGCNSPAATLVFEVETRPVTLPGVIAPGCR
jgi:hypothetical protein